MASQAVRRTWRGSEKIGAFEEKEWLTRLDTSMTVKWNKHKKGVVGALRSTLANLSDQF
jgi:hypothetical protein